MRMHNLQLQSYLSYAYVTQTAEQASPPNVLVVTSVYSVLLLTTFFLDL